MPPTTRRSTAAAAAAAADPGSVVLEAPPFSGTFARLCSHGDGSCFFHSIALALNWRGCRDQAHAPRVRTGRELRSRVVTRENWDAYSARVGLEDFGEETELDGFRAACDFRRPADNATWALTAHTLKLRVVVLVRPGEMYDSKELVPEDAPIALVAWIGRNHFEPIVSLFERRIPVSEPAILRSLVALRLDGSDERRATEFSGGEMAPLMSGDGRVGLLHPKDEIVTAVLALAR